MQSNFKVSPLQLVAAHRLGRAFGHFWAGLVQVPLCGEHKGKATVAVHAAYREDLLPLAGKSAETVEGINALADEAGHAIGDDSPYGEILAFAGPEMGYGANVLRHVTGTRRTEWRISPSGEVRIAIRRPVGDGLCDEVLVATLQMEGLEFGQARILNVEEGTDFEEYFLRHVFSLQDALIPLVGERRALAALAPVIIGAIDYQQLS